MTKPPRMAHEFTDALLIGIGLAPRDLAAAIAALHPRFSCLSVLVTPAQKAQCAGADEIWVAHRLGVRGALALIRRISWRRFACVYHPTNARYRGLALLRFIILPRPQWHYNIECRARNGTTI